MFSSFFVSLPQVSLFLLLVETESELFCGTFNFWKLIFLFFVLIDKGLEMTYALAP